MPDSIDAFKKGEPLHTSGSRCPPGRRESGEYSLLATGDKESLVCKMGPARAQVVSLLGKMT